MPSGSDESTTKTTDADRHAGELRTHITEVGEKHERLRNIYNGLCVAIAIIKMNYFKPFITQINHFTVIFKRKITF